MFVSISDGSNNMHSESYGIVDKVSLFVPMAGVALGGCGLGRRSADRTSTRTDRFPAQQRRAYFSFVSLVCCIE